jgi:hypothetical protein
MVDSKNRATLHHVKELRLEPPLRCFSLKLTRSVLDNTVLEKPSETFEEEIYHFLTLLNFDVPKIACMLDLNFAASTCFLPQSIGIWVSDYTAESIYRTKGTVTASDRSLFGPVNHTFPTRLLRGRLSDCTSRSDILSLNDDAFGRFKYTDHYAEKWKAVFPLAFNPLENPIIS